MNYEMNYDKLPSGGKVTSDGEKTKNHGTTCCGGRCYVFYDENRKYHVECEKCGSLVTYKARSQDEAIQIWNKMPRHIFGA
jgi:DNA-directed RNA polymerase subunit RPC12/RpoP